LAAAYFLQLLLVSLCRKKTQTWQLCWQYTISQVLSSASETKTDQYPRIYNTRT